MRCLWFILIILWNISEDYYYWRMTLHTVFAFVSFKQISLDLDDQVLPILSFCNHIWRKLLANCMRICKTSLTLIIKHLHQLGNLSKLCLWLFHHLTAFQLLQRIAVSLLLKNKLATKPFLSRIIIIDEK